jgi:aspartyl-tRNA(Asn)/glutamyl-tRNA(Gln) amidotransferase subunit B
MVRSGRDADGARRDLDLVPLDDAEALRKIVKRVVEANDVFVEHFARGREAKAVGYLMGRIMEETGGRADPRLARTLLEEALQEATDTFE